MKNNTDWQPLLKELRYRQSSKPFYHWPWYYNVLSDAGAKSIQLWETEYFQEMTDHQAIFNWLKGTGLRPILTAMDADNQKQFADKYIEAISKKYLKQKNNKILLPFRRVFMIASS